MGIKDKWKRLDAESHQHLEKIKEEVKDSFEPEDDVTLEEDGTTEVYTSSDFGRLNDEIRLAVKEKGFLHDAKTLKEVSEKKMLNSACLFP
jgi:hypothetical protein